MRRLFLLALPPWLTTAVMGAACADTSPWSPPGVELLSLRHRLVAARQSDALLQCARHSDCVVAEDVSNDSCCQHCGLPVAAYNRRVLSRVRYLYHLWCKPRRWRCRRCSMGCFNRNRPLYSAVCEQGFCTLRSTGRRGTDRPP